MHIFLKMMGSIYVIYRNIFIVIILQYTHLNLILLNWMITSGVGRRMKLVTLKSP